MAQTIISLDDVNLYTQGYDTKYSPTQYFNIPDNTAINSVQISYVLVENSNSYNTQDRACAINGSRAHGSGFIASGTYLTASLFKAGSNGFRMTLKSNTIAPNRYRVASIQLTIDYTPSGVLPPDPTPPVIPDLGVMTVSTTDVDAGVEMIYLPFVFYCDKNAKRFERCYPVLHEWILCRRCWYWKPDH